MNPPEPISHRRAWIEASLGALLVIAGVVITLLTFGEAEASGTTYILAFGPIVVGVTMIMHALSDLAGYRSFVAWRYLLSTRETVTRRTKLALLIVIFARALIVIIAIPLIRSGGGVVTAIGFAIDAALLIVLAWGILRFSRLAFWSFIVGFSITLLGAVLMALVSRQIFPGTTTWSQEGTNNFLLIVNIVMIGGGVISGLAAFFGTLRAWFTFFTTVPIGGVWIGTSALVCVLAVMSGFETDLREKILGSNAHIQITREDGEFLDWKNIKARIDKVPGVVASTPYAVSEVVIAAHNNGMNVIIKGIDPATVASVTDLVSDLEDKNAMQRLAPLLDMSTDLSVPQKPHTNGAMDPAPDDLPTAADPIDFSSGSDAPSFPSDKLLEPPPAEEPTEPFGGDARAAHPAAPGDVVDAPPDDFTETSDNPTDFSQPDAVVGLDELDRTAIFDSDGQRIDVVDIPEPTLSRRTQSLHGVLVGRELVKQTHLYTGEEVRVVSPLSDPSNPDATGTPIPFNRDYRVAGIFFTGMYEYDLKYVYVSLDSLQDFLDRGDAIDGIEVRVSDADDSERMIGVLGKALGPGYRIVDWRELNRSLFSALKLEKIAMFLVLGIVILVASFSIVGNLIMVVVEKAREIALLKTLGASNFGMMQLFAIQGLMIGMIGTALGIATGLLGCWAGKKFGLPLNPDVYYIDRLPIHVDPQSVAAAAAAGILISIGATIYPALLAARVRPAAGMRH